MANPLNRALIACSVSALALAIVTLYYWQLRKRRKSSGALESDAPNSSSQAEHIASDIREDSQKSDPISCTASAKKAISVEATGCALEADTNELTVPDNQSTISLDNGYSIREDSVQILESASTQLSQSPIDIEEQYESVKLNSDLSDDHSQLLAHNCPVENNTCPISSVSEDNIEVDNTTTPLPETPITEDTMQLKSSNNRAASFSSPTNHCSDDNDLVGKMKNRLSISEETAPSNHLKVSSIEFESDSKSTNSILTIEVVPTGSNQVDAGATDAINEQSSGDETDKGNCESRLHQETTDDGAASSDNKPIINSNEIENNGAVVDSGEITCTHAEVERQSSPQISPAAQETPAVNITKQQEDTKPKPSSAKVVLSQTFAQVLAAKNNSNSNQTTAESNENKQMPAAPVNKSVLTNTYASVAQEKEETDAYHNYPDAVPSQATLNEGQCSPNSEFGECSDVHSQGSNDSGKGSSEILHADPVSNGDQASSSSYHAVNPSDDQVICYQFEMPHYLCGKLIGASGHFINSCKQRSNTQIVVNTHFYNSENKICSITGKKSNINIALNLIRRRFPIKEYPNVTLGQINLINPIATIPLSQACQLHLPPDIITDVILSCTINAGHFFLQQPTHPSYPQLNQLDNCMKVHYSEGSAPQMPQVYPGIVCAAPTAEGWYRALIKTVHESNAECDIMFVDYGGFAFNVPVSTLRQIRYDFLSLPFQASECYLSNVVPVDPENDWTLEANSFFDKLAQGQIIYASINGYTEDGVPFVNLFKLDGSNRVFINKELVANGHGVWVDNETAPATNSS